MVDKLVPPCSGDLVWDIEEASFAPWSASIDFYSYMSNRLKFIIFIIILVTILVAADNEKVVKIFYRSKDLSKRS